MKESEHLLQKVKSEDKSIALKEAVFITKKDQFLRERKIREQVENRNN